MNKFKIPNDDLDLSGFGREAGQLSSESNRLGRSENAKALMELNINDFTSPDV